MGDWLERHRGYVAMTLGYAIILAGVLFLRNPRSDETPIEIQSPTAVPTATVAPIRVHVSGAVHSPGVFSLPAGSRVQEVVEVAGGATEEADLDRINLAAWVNDGQKIYVPRQGEIDPPAASPDAGTSTGLAGTGKSTSTTDADGTGDPDTKADTKRSRKAPPKDEAAEAPSPAIPGDQADRDALIEEAVQEQVERLIARAAKVGAWGQAEEYCRARFTGPHLAYALAELREAEDEARRKRAARQAA